jgi:hypothetical protein
MLSLDERIAIERWRRKHKRCDFCKYLTISIPVTPNCDGAFICKAKAKDVSVDLPRPFCKLFKLKEIEL